MVLLQTGDHLLIQMGSIFRTLNVSGGSLFLCLLKLTDGIFILLQSKPALLYLPQNSSMWSMQSSSLRNDCQSSALTEQTAGLRFV